MRNQLRNRTAPRRPRAGPRPPSGRSLVSEPDRGRGSGKKPLLLLCCLLAAGLGWWLCHPQKAAEDTPLTSSLAEQPEPDGPAWRNLSALLAGRLDELPGAACLEIPVAGGAVLSLRTGLDPEVQQRVEEGLSRSQAVGAGAAVLDPRSGRILALACYNRDPARPMVFFWKSYPAASLIKVVTAAAAIETGRLEPCSILTYTGGPYSLRPRDLGPETRRWSSRVTLQNAFARSLNTVLGRIGIYETGPNLLREFGTRFFFNRPLPCEVPFESSFFPVPEDRFGIAQAASGYNQRTLITTLHAAWIAALVAAGGASPTPWLVERVEGEPEAGGPSLHRPGAPIRVLSTAAANKMQQLMEATITEGTCRRSFAPRHRSALLRTLRFGGKTGNINNEEDTLKYDWFMGYAKDAAGIPSVALSVFVLHDRQLGHRANRVAFDLFQGYFQNRETAPSSRP